MNPQAKETARFRVRVALGALLALACLVRVWLCFVDGPLHPDEYFQYLEPAWWHLTGRGMQAWEWRDGIRSWVLPFYHGAWLATLMQLGIHRGTTLVWILKTHWALVNASIVFAAYRGGAFVTRRLLRTAPNANDFPAGFEGGLLAAWLAATFPMLVWYAGHTLSELPSMLGLFAGLVLAAELTEQPADAWSKQARNKAVLSGILLSLGVCLRIANAPLVCVAPLWLLLRRRYRAALWLCLAALLPALVFALVDLLTWGSLAGSFVAYLKFNLIEGKAVQFGTEPADFYVKRLWQRLPFTLPLLLLPALWGVRGTWPFLLSALGAVGYLSTQAHKEDRFIIVVWPFLLVAAAGTVGAWLARVRAPRAESTGRTRGALPRYLVLAGTVSAAGALLADAIPHSAGRTWVVQERLDAQAWVGAQPDVTGLLIDAAVEGGGALWFGNPAPHMQFDAALLGNPLISHVLVAADGWQEQVARSVGFTRVHSVGPFAVLARTPNSVINL